MWGKVAFVNDQSKDRTLSYKNKEYHLFAEYIGRDYLYLTDASFDQFVDFCKNKTCFFTKPNKGTHGDGAQKIKLNANADLNKIYIELKDKNMIVEDYIEQIKELAEIHQNSLNTIRVNTIFLNNKVNIITALIRFGNNNSCVDNVSSGGMAASIDINTGIINSFAKDYNLNEFIMHPITNKQITGLTIPHWDAVKKLVIELAPMTPENMYVAWDIAITETVPVLVEGNPLGCFRIQQMPRQEGVKKLYEPFIKF